MWCRECHREVDAKGAGSACPSCGRALVASSRQTDDIRRAYEILERWQSSDLFERINTTAPLTTLKQQDRAPLLNIPLGAKPPEAPPVTVPKPTVVVQAQPRPAPVVAAVVQEPAAVPRIEVSRNRVTAENLKPKVPATDQMIWDLVVQPKPFLAAVVTTIDSTVQDQPSLPVTPDAMAAGVSESRASRAAAEAEVAARMQVWTKLSETTAEATADELMQNNASARMLEPLGGLAASPDSSRANARFEASFDAPADDANNAPDDYEAEEDHANDRATAELTAAEDRHFAAFAEQDSSASQDDSADEINSAFRIDEEFTESWESRSPEAGADESRTSESTATAELPQTVLFAPMSTASIREESASLQPKSAEAANDIKQAQVEATKKTQRIPMRRPPLHRRFQLERPVSESSAGSDTVTRKLRLDQTGGNAEASQEKEPVTSLPSSVAPETKIVSNSPKPGRRFRVDTAESVESITETAGSRSRTHGRPKHRYIDEAHESTMRGPHFEVSTPRRSNLTSMTGQFLAYLGVLGLTVGTAMVIYGHFGGYSEYTPTGWLVTTVAQMLLFLGVINLVSGGIEQNNEDVSRRINTLGEQLLRIEQVTSEVARGPRIPARMYAEDAEAEEMDATSRETVAVDRR